MSEQEAVKAAVREGVDTMHADLVAQLHVDATPDDYRKWWLAQARQVGRLQHALVFAGRLPGTFRFGVIDKPTREALFGLILEASA